MAARPPSLNKIFDLSVKKTVVIPAHTFTAAAERKEKLFGSRKV